MGSKHGWTEVRIAELDTASLQQLLMNARSKDATDLVEMCEAELKKRAAVSFPPRKARTSPFRNREDQIAAEIGEFARKLAQEYDLSPETASKLSRGYTGFRPHTLTDKRGDAKLGG